MLSFTGSELKAHEVMHTQSILLAQGERDLAEQQWTFSKEDQYNRVYVDNAMQNDIITLKVLSSY